MLDRAVLNAHFHPGGSVKTSFDGFGQQFGPSRLKLSDFFCVSGCIRVRHHGIYNMLTAFWIQALFLGHNTYGVLRIEKYN
jgi:hypothetical protein